MSGKTTDSMNRLTFFESMRYVAFAIVTSSDFEFLYQSENSSKSISPVQRTTAATIMIRAAVDSFVALRSVKF